MNKNNIVIFREQQLRLEPTGHDYDIFDHTATICKDILFVQSECTATKLNENAMPHINEKNIYGLYESFKAVSQLKDSVLKNEFGKYISTFEDFSANNLNYFVFLNSDVYLDFDYFDHIFKEFENEFEFLKKYHKLFIFVDKSFYNTIFDFGDDVYKTDLSYFHSSQYEFKKSNNYLFHFQRYIESSTSEISKFNKKTKSNDQVLSFIENFKI